MNLYSAAITLFLVMDPIGNIPLFLSVLKNVEAKKRKRIIFREMMIALAILLVFLFFGKSILAGFQISQPALRLSGGVILFLIALKMIFPSSAQEGEEADAEPVVVPLATPLIAGPSAMAIVTLFSVQHPEKMGLWAAAVLISWSVSSVILISSDFLRKLMGDKIIKAVERLMGMILTTMAIEMILAGIAAFLQGLS